MKQELQTAAQEAKNAAKTKSTVSLTLEQQNIEGHHGALMTAEKKLKTLPSNKGLQVLTCYAVETPLG